MSDWASFVCLLNEYVNNSLNLPESMPVLDYWIGVVNLTITMYIFYCQNVKQQLIYDLLIFNTCVLNKINVAKTYMY